MVKKLIWWLNITLVSLLISGILLSGCGKAAPPPEEGRANWPSTVSIASGDAKGSGAKTAMAITEIIRKYVGVSAVGEPGAGDAISTMVSTGDVEFGMATSKNIHSNVYAPELMGIFKSTQPHRILMVGHPTIEITAVHRDSDINSFDDLRGKKWFIGGSTATSVMQIGWATMDVFGLTKNDFDYYEGPGAKGGKEGMINRTVDAWTYVGGSPFDKTPSGSFLEIDAAVGMRWLDYGKGKAQEVVDKIPGLIVSELAPGWVNEYQTEPIYVVGWTTSPMCNANLPDSFTYEVTKAIWENIEELRGMTTIFNAYQMPRSIENPPGPFHPGAIKYYKEIGAWTSEIETNHQALLDKAQAEWNRTH
ncbi:TAXI family TRAP transporter solute-binding subunit [Chloroflexota bacterium]